eukprot:CAMPEP_0196587062 /NCGR_PEP_ID=MMETSP1081-20130531/56333_1 /TAXON_ID=36882 /ORGANISM="Pyramimonas amylifera, Strain CCMP720" /LENGTH=312 /DNA_ID=CAMNT_0041909141 /DNA_START=249 /DNA_END=1188 /DNA_ORIENTATION=-
MYQDEAINSARERHQEAAADNDGRSMVEKIESGLYKVLDSDKVERVVASLRATAQGKVLEKEHPRGHQLANSFLTGLTAEPFHDSADYHWATGLEKHWEIVRDEFLAGLKTSKVGVGGEKWSQAVRGDALSYGPEWRTLVLQDRGRWADDDTTKAFFPKTTKLLKELEVPSSEVFFARQGPHTGIKSHTDFSNFTLTAHLALVVPEGDCWIKVGNETTKWEEGKTIVMDTSFMHETFNNTEKARYVLISRFWHPEVTNDEKNALLYVFDCLDIPGVAGMKQAQRNLQKRIKKGRKTIGKNSGSVGGRGFGSR